MRSYLCGSLREDNVERKLAFAAGCIDAEIMEE